MQHKYHPGIRTLITKAVALASVDGGFVIATYIFAFLCTHFSLRGQAVTPLTSFNLSHFIAALINMLTLAVIIVRIAGLNRGLKYPFASCYQQALRRLPSMIALHIIGALMLLFAILPIAKFFAELSISPLLILLVFALLPFGIIACSFVIDQELSPVKALIATFNLIRQRLDYKLTVSLVLVYCIPLSLFAILPSGLPAQYINLIEQIWTLFCNIIAITIYAENNVPSQSKIDKNVKIIVA